jgi:hypothetical protein
MGPVYALTFYSAKINKNIITSTTAEDREKISADLETLEIWKGFIFN